MNSDAGHGPDEIAPWVFIPGSRWNLDEAGAGYTHDTSVDEFVDVLAMLRAKGIEEAIVWWNDPAGAEFYWSQVEAALYEVYVPQIAGATVLFAANEPTFDLDALRYTLRFPEDLEREYIELEAGGIGNDYQVALEVVYDNLDQFQPGGYRWNFEGSILVEDDEGGADDIRGEVYVWDWEHDPPEWALEYSITDFTSAPHGFGFFAPCYEVEGEEGLFAYETRRSFPIGPRIQNGEMKVEIVLRQPAASGPFTARIDLTQLIAAPISACDNCNSIAQGADFDHSLSVNVTDWLAFQAAYALGKRSADQNRDGQVNAQDMVIFGAKYNGPP